MKMKRWLIVAVVLCLCVALLAGCSPKAEQSDGLEQISDESLPLADGPEGYASWGKTEWESASEDQKNEVCLLLLRAHTPELKAMDDETILAQEDSISTTKVLIDQLFLVDEKATIGELMEPQE